MPYRAIHKYETGTDEWVGDVTVGMFPATLAVSPSTGLVYVVNFNLHGDMEPSSISVVEAETMIELAQIPTGIMPHGARSDAKGARLYSVNMNVEGHPADVGDTSDATGKGSRSGERQGRRLGSGPRGLEGYEEVRNRPRLGSVDVFEIATPR